MENKVIDIILTRIDKLEDKIDILIGFKWRVVGGTIIASMVLTGLFQMLLVLMKK